jgi:hypothetical protein
MFGDEDRFINLAAKWIKLYGKLRHPTHPDPTYHPRPCPMHALPRPPERPSGKSGAARSVVVAAVLVMGAVAAIASGDSEGR